MRSVAAFGLDALIVVAFVAISTVSHRSVTSWSAIALGSLPFLGGVALGWLVSRSWRGTLHERSFVAVWGLTVIAGFAYRFWTPPAPKAADVVVAVLVLGFLFGGWRLMAHLIDSLRVRREAGLPVD